MNTKTFNNKSIAIIGAGASGCACAYFLAKIGLEVTLFDKGTPLRTLLPTGCGRCNLAHAEFDPKELAKNYPRGEKFLYSVFSKFSTSDTLEMFEEMKISTYIQENGRIFPESNSAKLVREDFLKELYKKTNIIKEEVKEIVPLERDFKIITTKANYLFSHIVIAIGGHSSYKLLENFELNIIEPKPSLVGLNSIQDFKNLSGTVVRGVNYNGIVNDLLFTHFGVSGPLIYTISSIKAFDKMPYKLNIDLAPNLKDLQNDLNTYPHKEIKNILTKYLPVKVVKFVLKDIDDTTKAHKINGKIRDLILDRIHRFEIEIIGTNNGEETVTAGGIDLDEINPKTMELKKHPNIFCIGEVLNIDGFCGGFNLQNAWSTGFVCAQALSDK